MAKLGEELPIFCERCGYSLHGLPQTRCEHCTILQFHCPECGHHQPINTLRPILGQIEDQAAKVGVATPVFASAKSVFDKAVADGWGELDIASVHDQVSGESALSRGAPS